MERVGLSAAVGSRVVSLSLDGPEASPGSFLKVAEGEPRGFWARGDRWVVHHGVAAEVAMLADGSEGADRFRAVWSNARDLLGDAPPEEGGARLYGGFAFRSDHRQSDEWDGFPTALFHLPAVEISGGNGAVRLRARAVAGADESDTEVEHRLRARLDEVCHSANGLSNVGATTAVPVGVDRRDSDRAAWEAGISECLRAIAGGSVSKVVLARTLDVVTERVLNPIEVLAHLWEHNRGTHVFLFEPQPGAALVGAAPETVSTLRRGAFQATAVAGTIGIGDGPDTQRALAIRLLASAKDMAEHRIALDDMVARLTPLADNVEAQPEPHVLTLSRIQHLETDIRASIPEGTTVLDILEALHPTPAVCGLPRDAALDVLSRREPFERGWYAGPVGWFDGQGNGVFAPALRCAVARGRHWRLFAGAGIVAGSDAAMEWEESGIKFEPVLRALKASGAEL